MPYKPRENVAPDVRAAASVMGRKGGAISAQSSKKYNSNAERQKAYRDRVKETTNQVKNVAK